MVWRLLAAGEARVAAAAPLYGPFPDGGDLGKGEGGRARDLRRPRRARRRDAPRGPGGDAQGPAREPRPRVRRADHAFFNDTGPRFNPPAAAEAYRRVLDWFGRNAA